MTAQPITHAIVDTKTNEAYYFSSHDEAVLWAMNEFHGTSGWELEVIEVEH